MMQAFSDRFLKQLPVVFPLVVLFHILLFGYTAFTLARAGVLDTPVCYGSCIELLFYALLWLAVCDRRRWAAIAYILLTAANLLLHFLTTKGAFWEQISDVLLPFDVLMCVFLLFYYKRFR